MTGRDDSILEQRLRQALQPVDPPAEFAERVAASAGRRRAPAGTTSRSRLAGPWARFSWLDRHAGLSAAATVALAVALAGSGLLWHQRTQELRARRAHEQVVQALRVTSEALNTALKITVDPSWAG